jgi:hypothetical protein
MQLAVGEMRNAYKILVGGKRPFRKHRCGWKDNITTDI